MIIDENGYVHVVGAVILREGKILCTKRPEGKRLAGYWEFPGGKMEEGETEKEALEREIREELACQVELLRHVMTFKYTYDFGNIHLSFYFARICEGEPILLEHSQALWLAPEEISSLEWAPAETPLVEYLSELTHAQLLEEG